MIEKIVAPWTKEQVAELQRHQNLGIFHPYTCGTKGCKTKDEYHGNSILIPTEYGWICPNCDYTQDWAHASMADKIANDEGEAIMREFKAIHEKNEQ